MMKLTIWMAIVPPLRAVFLFTMPFLSFNKNILNKSAAITITIQISSYCNYKDAHMTMLLI